MKKIIFICTGNTCRSPMAEIILKNKLKQRNIKDVCVSSAGIMVNHNDKMNDKSKIALSLLGYKSGVKLAKQLTKSLVNSKTILITMTSNQKSYVCNLAKTYALSDFNGGIDLPDPFGKSQEEYLKCAKILNFVLDEVVELIESNKL